MKFNFWRVCDCTVCFLNGRVVIDEPDEDTIDLVAEAIGDEVATIK